MYSSSSPWCPVLAHVDHSLFAQPLAGASDPCCPWQGELLLALQRHSCPKHPSWQQQLRQRDLGHTARHSLLSPQGPAGVHPMAQAPRTRPGSITTAELPVKGATADKHPKNTLEKGWGSWRKEGQGTSEIPETPGEIEPDLGEKTRHSSILRAGHCC